MFKECSYELQKDTPKTNNLLQRDKTAIIGTASD